MPVIANPSQQFETGRSCVQARCRRSKSSTAPQVDRQRRSNQKYTHLRVIAQPESGGRLANARTREPRRPQRNGHRDRCVIAELQIDCSWSVRIAEQREWLVTV